MDAVLQVTYLAPCVRTGIHLYLIRTSFLPQPYLNLPHFIISDNCKKLTLVLPMVNCIIKIDNSTPGDKLNNYKLTVALLAVGVKTEINYISASDGKG